MISGIHIHPDLKKAFLELGFEEMTEIQKKTIPFIQQGKDVIGQSFTGSGKTAAFGFPILERITHNQGLQALILVPTRELCEQVTTEMRKFAKYKRMDIIAVYGGVSIGPQINQLTHADIVVATPGRMLDHLERGTIDFRKVRILVLDEADKMFEMGFIDDVKKIISQVSRERQTLLFSATISHQVQEIVKSYMKNPEKVKVQSYVGEEKLEQFYYSVSAGDKFSLLMHLIKQEKPGLTIIFCATRNRVDSLSKNLYKQGINAQSLHGGLTQNRRKQAIDMFHGNKVDILVASDVAARGLDIKNVMYIINYDIPKTSKEYIHRIGRTARAGKEGKVISLLAPQDHDNFRNVLGDRSLVVKQLETPKFERLAFIQGPRGGDSGRSSFGRGGGRGGYRGGSGRPQSSGHAGYQERRPYHPGQRTFHTRPEGKSDGSERRGSSGTERRSSYTPRRRFR